ncbi:hypothetical protein FF38_11734 [Lucilia cuprina]|uniref:Uncharacterized protein n=1 Tax=Lucilia cuprina TaxID=7375 RepID=A0A0L0CEI7_LUCCU|nr:hypothetical protein CVS40_6199 [Lucilia cuprina]KNC30671.1 hypothetical protein FF38_11734 [Lucilia cuprina]
MDNSTVKISSNWSQIGGCPFSQAAKIQAADPDIFAGPSLDVLVDEEKSILLNKGDSSENCELDVEIFPHYKIQAASFVCNVPKVEVFLNPVKEYLETIYGVVVDDSDDQFKSYRYDVQVEKSGVTYLTLKFLTDFCDVCIFGIMLHTAPNPNGITTSLPNTACINIENVQNMLQNSRKQPGPTSERCKQLLELMTKANQSNTLTLDQLMKQKMNIDQIKTDKNSENDDILNQLKLHIDDRLQKMEQRINRYLEHMEERQMQKLDVILNTLQHTNK